MKNFLEKKDFIDTIFTGDCLDHLKTLPESSVDMVLTDIPYDEVNASHQRKDSLRRVRKGDADTLTFNLILFLQEILRVCKGSFYIFCGVGQISHIRAFFDSAGLTTRLGVWNKTNPSPMNGEYVWLSGLEYCLYAKKPGATFNEHCKKAVWDFPSGSSKSHPTQKPLALFQRLIKASSNKGDLVLDPCLGSGTTSLGCVSLGRHYVGIERNPDYVSLANNRLAAYSREIYDQWDDRYIPLESDNELPEEMNLGDLFGDDDN